MPLKEQPRDDALAGEEDTIGQEHAEIRIAGARDSAGVLYPDLIGETPGYHEEVGVDDRRAVVCDLIDVLPPPPMLLDSIRAISTCAVERCGMSYRYWPRRAKAKSPWDQGTLTLPLVEKHHRALGGALRRPYPLTA